MEANTLDQNHKHQNSASYSSLLLLLAKKNDQVMIMTVVEELPVFVCI